MTPNEQGTRLRALLALEVAPIAIAFLEEPPPGVEHVAQQAPAGCSYWRAAADGAVFYTDAADHLGCAVGAHTHAAPMGPEKQAELMGLIDTMVSLSYLRPEDVPTIPRRASPLRIAVYAPLAKAPAAPDVVLVRGAARTLMLLAEASDRAGIAGTTATMGRPTCAVIPQSIGSNRTAASFGCVGNRVYTGARDDEAYFAIPGVHVDSLIEALAIIVSANEQLDVFHRARLAPA